MFERMLFLLEKIKGEKPLVLNLTNYVTMDLMANCLLAIGAAPIMSYDEREIEELIIISSAININLGTLNTEYLRLAHHATEYAYTKNKPIVLDPVGAGASNIRTQSALEFLPKSTIVRGNASEIIALYDNHEKTHGVEAIHSSNQALHIAKKIILKNKKLTIVISGQQDIILSEKEQICINFGSPTMTLITGMGCTLTAIIAAFCAVCVDAYEASFFATTFFGLCGQQAGRQTSLPGSFREAFINALYAPDLSMMKECLAGKW